MTYSQSILMAPEISVCVPPKSQVVWQSEKSTKEIQEADWIPVTLKIRYHEDGEVSVSVDPSSKEENYKGGTLFAGKAIAREVRPRKQSKILDPGVPGVEGILEQGRLPALMRALQDPVQMDLLCLAVLACYS
ncbi:MAG: hypothetical protein O6840_00130 [Nitrospirae bacterium]|nr:hypothetical protein [Nitrospirota bacterium]